MNSYKFYYLKILRSDFLVRYNLLNPNSIFKLKEVVVYFYLLNIDKDLNDEFLRAAFLLEYLVGRKSILKAFKFKYKYDSSEVNFYCCVRLHGDSLYDFLANLYVVLYKVRFKFKRNVVGTRYTVSFKNIKTFFNFGILEEEYFQWNKYLNINFSFSRSNSLERKIKSIVKTFI